ncbi:MAG: hypothetical protein PHH60_03420 [Candidatus Margulisbacteria bacterium]|nr:hypothetical protein [Candidatus Margulisiibacteriota bacterium]
MIKKTTLITLTIMLTASFALADQQADQDYLNKLYYRHNKLEIVTKKRLIDEKRNYSNTDIDSTTYSFEAYSNTSTNISTTGYSRSEVKEVNEWYIYLGGISELSDIDFLQLIGDQQELSRAVSIEDQKAKMRWIGNVFIGVGLVTMLGGAAMSADQAVITGGALGMTAGFFFNAFNLSPAHYIKSAYAQAKIDEYNIGLKRKLNLPLSYE